MTRESQRRKKTPLEVTQHISVLRSIGTVYPTTSNTFNSCECSQLNQLTHQTCLHPVTATLTTKHVNSELSTSTPANLLCVPAPATTPVEALPDLLYASQPGLQLASAVISRSPENASQASVPAIAQAAVPHTNFQTNEARLQPA